MKKKYRLRAIIPLLLCCIGHSSAQTTSEHLTGNATSFTVLAGYDLYQTSEINGILEPRGYPSVPEFSSLPGIGASMSLYQFDKNLFSSTRFYTRLIDFDTDNWTNRAISFFGSVDFGYMIAPSRTIVTYVAGGGTFGTSSISMSPQKHPNRAIEEILDDSSATGNTFSLHTFHLGLHLDLGIDFFLEHKPQENIKYVIGLKAGKILVDIPIRTLNGDQAYVSTTGIPGYYAYLSLGFIFL